MLARALAHAAFRARSRCGRECARPPARASRYATTGDGILTALHVLNRMASTGKTLAEPGSVMTRMPQVLINVPDDDKARADEDFVLAAVAGTEPLVRVMVETGSAELAQQIAERLAEVVGQQLALT